MNDWVTAILDAVASVEPWLRTLLVGVGMLLETSVLLGFLVPGDTIVIVGATGIEDVWQWAALVVACVLGALAGESIGFAIGRAIGPGLDRWLDRRWPRGSREWRRAERYVRRRGGPAIFLSRFLPVAHSLVPLIAGASGMPYRRFLTWTVPACVLWSLAYTSVGWLVAGSFRELADTLHSAGVLFAAAIVLFVVLTWLGKRWLLRREARHMEEE